MAIRVAFIGAGSIGFTCGLMRDMLCVPELQDTEFRFTDISARNLDMVTQLARRDIVYHKLPATILATTNRRKALEGADYVINCTRIGGLEAFKLDIDIPLKYGIDQCVGDTLCAGGIIYGQRNIPQVLAFCKDMREVSAAKALFINYANPNAMNTWAAIEHGGVPTIGCCHGVQGAHWQITHVIELWAKTTGRLPKDYVSPGHEPWNDRRTRMVWGLHRREVPVIAAGLNHQTWFIKVMFQGEDVTARLPELFGKHPVYPKTEKVRIDVLKRFGYFSTESNGHLSEYVAWYRKRPKEIKDWIEMSSWINGETGGYLRVCIEGRNWFKTDFPNWLKETPQPIGPDHRSEEHASSVIEAIHTGRVYRGHLNVRNGSCITNLPPACVVEVPCYVDKTGIHTPIVGDLPPGCAAVCSASAWVQRLSIEAAVRGEVTLLKQAMLMDPLTGAVCNPDEISQMTDELLIAQAEWLPQYRREIPKAKKRFAAEKRLGTKSVQGAARVRTQTVADMKRHAAAARANAAAADKAKMTRKGKRR